jgi:hypothetical protein
VPGSATVDLQPGTQIVLVAGSEDSDADLAALANVQVTVVAADTGQAVPVSRVEGDTGFGTPDQGGNLTLQFTVPQAGPYRITAAYPEGQEGPPAALILLRDVFSLATVAQRAGALCCASVLLAIVIPVGVFLARRNAKRSEEGPAAPPDQAAPEGGPA